MKEYKYIELDKIIDFKKSASNKSNFTKKFIHDNKGEVPVFGASKYRNHPSYGYVKDNLKGVKYFENCLTWNIDGSLGCFYRTGRFSLSEKVIPLYLKENVNIDLDYFSYILINKSIELGFDRHYKPNQTALKKVEIQIPVKLDGSYDLKVQKEIAKKYKKIEVLKNELENYLIILKSTIVVADGMIGVKYSSVSLLSLFTPYKGSAKYTSKFLMNEDEGMYPVYSGATVNYGKIGTLKTFDWNTSGERWMTWTTDGVYAGTVFLRNGKFTMNTHCGLLKPNENNMNIDIEYIHYILNKHLSNYAVGEQNKRVTKGILKEVEIQIPVKLDGSYDLKAQKEIAKKYQEIEKKQKTISELLKQISQSTVSIT
ncbi:MAG: restriction endonuclease subunit S [Alphaproteobacteria bacterium]|nr:restriction endonuclease subunit S [Alphaproteobacteria bacterium]